MIIYRDNQNHKEFKEWIDIDTIINTCKIDKWEILNKAINSVLNNRKLKNFNYFIQLVKKEFWKILTEEIKKNSQKIDCSFINLFSTDELWEKCIDNEDFREELENEVFAELGKIFLKKLYPYFLFEENLEKLTYECYNKKEKRNLFSKRFISVITREKIKEIERYLKDESYWELEEVLNPNLALKVAQSDIKILKKEYRKS
jgi:hypothetical protein